MPDVSRIVGVLLLLTWASSEAALVAEYRMDELQWTGAPGEVLDSSGSAFHGVAQGSTTTVGQLCNGADLTATGTADYLDLDEAAIDGIDDFTMMLWYRSSNTDRTMLVGGSNAAESNELWWRIRNGNRTVPRLKDDRDGNILHGLVADGAWHHLAWTRDDRDNCFYIDGVLVGCRDLTSAPLDVDPTGFIVGQEIRNLGYDFRPNGGIEGFVDEYYVFDHVMTQAEIDAVRLNNIASLNWDGSPRSCSLVSPQAIYRFDEPSWNSTPDEVADSSGNDYHGTAFSTDTVPGLLCRAADFRDPGTADYLSIDRRAIDGATDFTIMAWINSPNDGQKAIVSGARAGQANELIFWWWSATNFSPYVNGGGSPATVQDIFDNTWHHVAWTRSGTSNCLYFDGVLEACVTLATGSVDIDPGGLIIGQEQDNVGNAFNPAQDLEGLLDEVLFFGTPLTAGEIQAIRTNHLAGNNWDGTPRTCPTFGAAVLEVIHDGAGIHCLDEVVTVRALDGAGVPVSGYAQTITLDTSTGRGTWSLSVGAGTLVDATPDDGLATYAFDASDGAVASFALTYPEGNSNVDVDVAELANPTVTDDDSEGILPFSPSGFTVTASQLSNPPPIPINDPLVSRTAGTDFDVHVAAYGVSDTDPVCGVIEDYIGDKSLHIWQELVDPGSGTRFATVDGISIAGSEAAASTQTVTFTAGQASVVVKYKDAGRLRIQFKDETSSPTVVRGATDDFVARPANLSIVTIEDASGNANPAATSSSGAGFVPAGVSFVVDVDVLDAEGTLLPNFGAEVAAEGIELRSASLLIPAGGRNGSAGDGSLGNPLSFLATGIPGRWRNSAVYFDEVGIVQLQASVADGDFLTTGPLSGALTGNVGRFYPEHFELLAASLTPACGAFSYMSDPNIGLTYDVQARNLQNARVQNYDEGVLGVAGVAGVRLVAENADDGIDRGLRMTQPAANWVLGNYNAAATSELARAVSPDGPFDNLAVGLTIDDLLDGLNLSGVDMEATSIGDCTVGPTCDAETIGFTEVYYGRLTALPAFGPENVALPVDVESQVFDGTAFVEHTPDSCSVYQDVAMTLSNFQGNLTLGETTVAGPPAATNLILGHTNPAQPALLSAPGFSNDGSVDVEFTVPVWLQYDWLGTGNTHPRATATFGRYRGHDRIVFWQQDP